MPILSSSNSAANKDLYDVKNMNKRGYNYLIEQKMLWKKGEIARYKQFLIFPECFQKLSVVDAPI